MPEMTSLGWPHTILGAGKVYLFLTLILAGSALGIYNRGGFGIAHVLAVLKLIARLLFIVHTLRQ